MNLNKLFNARRPSLGVAILTASTVLATRAAEPTSPEPAEPPTQLPVVVVTAQKEAAQAQSLPVSVTAVPESVIDQADIQTVREAAIYSPNTTVNEFTSRAVSNPYFRGIGGSPANPGVTTFIDQVPHFNAYSSSIQLIDVDQIEFVRGPQGSLFGRNTAGGFININSRPPSPFWTGSLEGGYGSYNLREVRVGVSGPIFPEHLTFSLTGGYSARDGYTVNDFNGDDIDFREAGFGKAQLQYNVTERFSVRLIVFGENDDDGDFALGDLNYIRNHPHHVVRDYTEGYNRRDVIAPTLLVNYAGEKVDFAAITGGVWWENEARTDLDYSIAAPANFFLNAVRENDEEQRQFSQEFRFSSSEASPIDLGAESRLHWQSGVFLFTRNYDQHAVNTFAPPLAFQSGQSTSDLTDEGVGLYGQLRLELTEKWELSAGLRYDYESKEGDLSSTFSLPSSVEDDFSEVSPQAGLIYHFTPDHMAYGAVARGYKAGGFNPPPAGFFAPEGTESYDTEHTWNYEIGYKARYLEGKLETAAALFYIDWSDLQLNQQYPLSGGQFYIANAGAAYSRGFELEIKYRPWKLLDLFGSFGYTDAEFRSGSTSYNPNLFPPFGSNQDVSGNRLPYTPTFTGTFGSQLNWRVSKPLTAYFRAEVNVLGDFEYDASNAEGQRTFSLANFRAGLRAKNWLVEAWVQNAFDTEYVPIALPYGQLGAPSGYIGESGAPVTAGVRAGLMF